MAKKKKNRNVKGNGKPATSVAEAMSKASIDKAKLVKVRPVNRKKLVVDDVHGFGSKLLNPKGKPFKKKLAIHTVLSDFTALCDARITGLTANDSLTPEYVSCKKCLAHRIYKEFCDIVDITPAEEVPAEEVPAEESSKPVEEKPVEEKPVEEKPVEFLPDTDPKSTDIEPEAYEMQETEVVDFDEMVVELEEQILQKIASRLKKMEERLLEKLKTECQILLEARPRFFLIRKGNNLFQIVHDPSRYVIIDNLKEEIAEKALPEYLAIQFHWDGTSKPPSEWITECKKIGEKYAKALKEDKPRKVKRRSIKRRKDRPEPAPRKIRRRQK